MTDSVYEFEFEPCECCEGLKERICFAMIKDGTCPMMRGTT